MAKSGIKVPPLGTVLLLSLLLLLLRLWGWGLEGLGRILLPGENTPHQHPPLSNPTLSNPQAVAVKCLSAKRWNPCKQHQSSCHLEGAPSFALLAAPSWMPGPWQAWLGPLRAGGWGYRLQLAKGLELELGAWDANFRTIPLQPKFD
eukprot:1144517-Pelagomonas_calceolata.AAC.2